MSVNLTSLQLILEEIPDKGRRQRLLAKWMDEAIDVRDGFRREQTLIELVKKYTHKTMKTEHAQKDELLSSKEASNYLKIGMTKFIDYKHAGIVNVAKQMGNAHFFCRKHLDTVWEMEAHERNMILAHAPPKDPRWKRKKKPNAKSVDTS